MKIKLICVGKTVERYFTDAESEYLKRLSHYVSVEKIEIPELKNAKNLDVQEIKIREGRLVLDLVSSGDQVILLDENGKQFSSVDFAEFMQKKFNAGGKNLLFVVGGAYGFSDEVYARGYAKIALSKMTFSHQMVRVFFLEQLYRAHTILNHQPYHHH